MNIAVIFLGIGYHTDKPLLYYGKKLAAANGFQVKEVPYGGFETGIKGKPDKMRQAFESALSQSEKILQDIDFDACDTILFISKSIGTAVAAACFVLGYSVSGPKTWKAGDGRSLKEIDDSATDN